MTLGMAFVDSWVGVVDGGMEAMRSWFCPECLVVSSRSLAARGIFMDDHS